MIDVYCYYLGVEKQDDRHHPIHDYKCPHIGVAKIILGLSIQEIHRSYSTSKKWVPQDIGYERVTNIKPWTGDYCRAREGYQRFFGNRKYRLIWTTKEQFDEVCQSKLSSQLTLELE